VRVVENIGGSEMGFEESFGFGDGRLILQE